MFPDPSVFSNTAYMQMWAQQNLNKKVIQKPDI